MSGNSTQTVYPNSLFDQYTIAFEGSSVACILYGVYLVIAGSNLALLRKKRYNVLLSFTVLQFVFTTLYFAVQLYAGPAQILSIFNIIGSYGIDALSPWPSVIVDTMFVLNTWTSDAFLIYRCYIICMGNKYALAVPTLLYIGTVGGSLAWLIVSSVPGAVYSTQAVQIAGICYWSLTAVTNLFASCLISARLWMHRQALAAAVGPQQGAFYLGYMAMTLESAMLYTVFTIIALIVFVLNSPLENVFFPVLGTVQVIAPSLIIYRIARGISFETDERGTAVTASLKFASSMGPHGMLRPVVHPDLSEVSGTMHATSGESKKDRSSGSFIDEIKEQV